MVRSAQNVCDGVANPVALSYIQVRANRKSRHFGRDAEIQAMDGSQSVVQVLDSRNLPSRGFMFAVAGISRGPAFAIHGRWIPASLPE